MQSELMTSELDTEGELCSPLQRPYRDFARVTEGDPLLKPLLRGDILTSGVNDLFPTRLHSLLS